MSYPSDVAAVKSAIHTAVTIKTAPNSISPTDTGGNMEATCDLLTELYGLIGGAVALQGTLNAGNTANNTGGNVSSFTLSNSSNQNLIAPDSVTIEDSGSVIQAALKVETGAGKVVLKDPASANQGKILSGALTGARSVLLPNEGNGVGLASTLVTHTTKDPITVSSGSASTLVLPTDVLVNNSGVTVIGMVGSLPALFIKDAGSSYHSYIQAGSLTGSHQNYTPDRAGTLQLSGDGVNPAISLSPGAGTGATYSFSATSDDRSGTITLVTGTSPTATTHILTLNYTQAYPTATRVLIQCRQATITTIIPSIVAVSELPNQFTLDGTLSASTTYIITYIVAN